MNTLKRKVKANWEVLLLLLLPILLLLISQTWIFNPINTIDPWIYFGYFIRLKQYLTAFPEAYYGTRLSWILPGHLAYSLFSPLVANYVLHLGLYYIATISLYLVLKPSVGRRAAFLTSALMGCYSLFLAAIGWNYVDGAGITYFLLTVLMLSWAARKKSWTTWMLLSGIFFGALIYTNLVWLAFAPSLITYYFLINRPHRIQRTFISVAASVVGILAITLFLCSVNYAMVGKFFFFMPSVNYALGSGGQPNPLKIDLHEWVFRANWLFLPLTVLLGSAITLALSKFRKSFEQSDAVPFQALFIVGFLGMVFLEARVTYVLQLTYYASYLMPSTFLAIGASLKPLTTLSQGSFVAVATFSLILSIFPLMPSRVFDNQPAIFCLLFLAAVLFSIASNFNQKKVGSIVAILLLTISASLSFNQGWTASQSVGRLQANINSKAAIDGHLTVSTVQKLFRDIDPTASLWLWYSVEELTVYRSISAASLWSNRFISEEFPGLQASGISSSTPLSPQQLTKFTNLFSASSKIAIFSQQKDVLQQAINSLKPVGFTAKAIATYPIKQDTIAFTITIVKVSKLKDIL